MNDTIRLLLSHRSIRKFTDRPIEAERLRAIVAAAQMASSSSNIQAYSVIHVTDQSLKDRLSEYAENYVYVKECAAFLVWCADLYRLRETVAIRGGDPAQAPVGTTENTVAAIVDVALAAQNAAVAAESLGLGIVYIGGIRNRIADVSSLLGLPELVIPLFGMCLGYPAQEPLLRPRLPQAAVLHENRYDPSAYRELIAAYDAEYEAYTRERSNGQRVSAWSEDMARKLSVHSRAHMSDFLRQKGFNRG